MEVSRELLTRLFRDTRFPLVRHHLDSQDTFLTEQIPKLLKATNPHTLQLEDGRTVRAYWGGREGNQITQKAPSDEAGQSIVPHICRLDKRTYLLEIRVPLLMEYTVGTEVLTETLDDILLGRIPLMLRSRECWLSKLEPEEAFEAGECRYELGGYFIIGGAEKVMLTQERLGNNLQQAGQRSNVSKGEGGAKTLIEHAPSLKVKKPEQESDKETQAGIRSISDDGAIGPQSHFVIVPPRTESRRKRVAIITAPGYHEPVPLLSLFEALGVVRDKDLQDVLLAGVPDEERVEQDDIITELILSQERFKQDQEMSAIDFLKLQTRTQSIQQVLAGLHVDVFPHVEKRRDEPATLFRRKAQVLGHLTRMALDVSLGKAPPSDREHFRYKRLDATGELCFQEFKRIFKETARTFLTQLDRRLTFESTVQAGTKIKELVQLETLGEFWWVRQFQNEFEKSFKGQWGGKNGISQELSRLSQYSTLSHLRRISLQMDKSLNIAAPRRLHGSQYGLMCPSDSPDGKSIGFIKAFTTFCRLSTPTSAGELMDALDSTELLVWIGDVHPSTWNPAWTRVFLNSDLVGVITEDTESFHDILLEKRRSGEIHRFVSLAWNRLNNTQTIWCDGGRPVRPVLRPGVTAETLKGAKTWDATEALFDWIDAEESDTLMISMTPQHPKRVSEIHPYQNLAPSTAVVPFADYNAGTRNNFSAAQQQKQACGWYNTNFKKRFDTMATVLSTPSRPLAQTWMQNQAFGCMPQGQNVMVAILVQGGFNQEDSVLMNQGSLKRGLFDTTYQHSQTYEEEILDMGRQTHTEVANLTIDKWADVKRKPDVDYGQLDADGIIKVGSEVTAKTVLIGFVSPELDPEGAVKRYRDVSVMPKRGQRGRVDAVYRFRTSNGLLGVRIRLAERRAPTLGDKFASRHGQKGTIGAIVPEEDFPFTSKGVRPDLIMNPHAIPTRMTIGQLLESTCNKLGVSQGALTDATPFTVSQRIPDTSKLMTQMGFHPQGNEVLQSGQTGEQIIAEVFMGPVFQMRLKQMVEDKINQRDTGPRALLTHQPLEGRANDGGLRIGEMERDVLIAHGASAFAEESMMKRSDGEEVAFMPETGELGADTEHQQGTLEMPYAMKLFTQEVRAHHIDVKLITS